LVCKFTRFNSASYALHIPRTGTLPAASFRFHIADILVVQLMAAAINPIAVFHRLVITHVGRTKQAPLFFYILTALIS